ncbi:MAG: flagellar biosynthetic protein FliR [Planctomycetota bacterium]
MIEQLQPLLNKILFVVLISLRITGFMFTVPVLSSVIFPIRLKIILILLLSYILSHTIPVVNLLNASWGIIVLIGLSEILTGAFLGIIIYFIFLAIQIAGIFVDNEFGTSLMNILDPTTNESMTIVSQIYVLLFSLFFVTTDGINVLLLSLKETYDYINIGQITTINYRGLFSLFNTIFSKAFVFASPIIIPSFLTMILLGIASRIVPELNVFMVAFSLRIIIGMIILTFSLFIFSNYSEFVISNISIFLKQLVAK